jgi:hypothetical protein
MDFEEIYSLHSPQIFRVCMGYVNDAEQSEGPDAGNIYFGLEEPVYIQK